MTKWIALTVLSILSVSTSAYAGCEVVDGGKRTPFDGKSLSGLEVEKKSLSALGKAHPSLNVVEKTFKGEVKTCTACSDKYVTCSQ